ncbi:MAG: glycosyltransferase family 4 protein [Bacteroidales bacterium]|nr:glycosyltransferase family 4 protein [Bacteroidales bacterium]
MNQKIKKRTIAVNTRLLMPGKLDGIGWFTFETLKRIVIAHPEIQFIFLFDRKYSQEVIFAENVTPVVLGPPTRHPVLWYLWFEWRIWAYLKRKKPDLFLSTDGFLSLRVKTPSVAVIHDINFEHRPGDLPWLVRKYYRYYFPRFASKASRIVTVSEFSRRDIINQYEVPEEKVDLAYNGVNERYNPLTEDQAVEVRKKFTGGSPYFVFVGSIHPRKNITNLLKAFQLFKDENKGNYKLVVVGEKFFLTGPMEEQLEKMKNKKDVIFTGRLTPEQLNEVLGAAWAMTFVPYFEGFGIPIVEAMKCDIPVIASKATSLPEIAGDAAIFASPESPGSIRDGMIRMVREKGLREELIKKGRVRRKHFSWDHTAEKLWNSVQQVLDANA